MQDDEIVRLATANTPTDAHLWQQALEEEGISCRVVGDFLDGGIGDIPGFRSEVWVRHADVDRARAVLDEYVRAAPVPEPAVTAAEAEAEATAEARETSAEE